MECCIDLCVFGFCAIIQVLSKSRWVDGNKRTHKKSNILKKEEKKNNQQKIEIE